MINKWIGILLACWVLGLSQASWAGISGISTFGFEYDSEEFAKARFTNGDTRSIAAGKGYVLTLGLVLDFKEDQNFLKDLAIQATIGYKADGFKATNGSLSWDRFPVDLIGFYYIPGINLRLGGGLTYEFGNSLSIEKGVLNKTIDFKSTFGGLIEIDYFFGVRKNFLLGLRYKIIQYTSETPSANEYNANSLGLQFGIVF